MMRLKTYAGLSLIATLAVIYHAFSSRGQFYPAMVYLSTSKINLVLLLNMGLVVMCILWQLTKKIFLGSLREAEVERLNEQSWREVMEILFAITIFRQDFSVTFLSMVTTLLLIKALHWLAQKRVEYIETTPSVPKLSHIRIVSFMGFLLLIDSLFLYNSVKYLIETRKPSVSLFFAFENYGVPLHLIRELYETFRNFKIRVADYIRYRKIASNMNDRFPDATPEELTSSDATCIICREEMITAKKLICGHIFHVHCLRSWLERQNTCPTCRALVVPSENGTSVTGSSADIHQQGTSTASTSHGLVGANANITQQQARLQAAASAASIYEKSFVYPSPNALVWSPGYALPPQTLARQGSTSMANSDGQLPGGNVQYGPGLESNLIVSNSQLDAHRKLIEHQIEFLQHQLKLIQTSDAKRTVDPGTADVKGKGVLSSSSAIPDCSENSESEVIDR
ncbi:ERAD-associated E3 ubiquitin-protein ligase HRD1A-like isoform X2 [Olea europaea var. sylvestris]|uniref:ERAD-associated E3 ubiquitin-protein ligase HRD1A-like isoform X2 n=1 Tax=Olea europaea var. sylvestris TaxID=158386 RepID=UPI000C1CD6B5|nr:ERAD-associated E3 ubiquitin-protein ligase HRD1A-like isoform X2 [Olea europaea var. sylvestris]